MRVGNCSQFLNGESMPVSLFREPRSMYTQIVMVQQDIALYFSHDGEDAFRSLTIDLEIQLVQDEQIEALNAR